MNNFLKCDNNLPKAILLESIYFEDGGREFLAENLNCIYFGLIQRLFKNLDSLFFSARDNKPRIIADEVIELMKKAKFSYHPTDFSRFLFEGVMLTPNWGSHYLKADSNQRFLFLNFLKFKFSELDQKTQKIVIEWGNDFLNQKAATNKVKKLFNKTFLIKN